MHIIRHLKKLKKSKNISTNTNVSGKYLSPNKIEMEGVNIQIHFYNYKYKCGIEFCSKCGYEKGYICIRIKSNFHNSSLIWKLLNLKEKESGQMYLSVIELQTIVYYIAIFISVPLYSYICKIQAYYFIIFVSIPKCENMLSAFIFE